MTCHPFQTFRPRLKIFVLPMLLKIGHLDMGIQDEANEVDAAVVENLVPLSEIIKAGVECGGNLSILGVFVHVFPPLLHQFNDGEGTVNRGSGGMREALTG